MLVTGCTLLCRGADPCQQSWQLSTAQVGFGTFLHWLRCFRQYNMQPQCLGRFVVIDILSLHDQHDPTCGAGVCQRPRPQPWPSRRGCQHQPPWPGGQPVGHGSARNTPAAVALGACHGMCTRSHDKSIRKPGLCAVWYKLSHCRCQATNTYCMSSKSDTH